MIRLSAIKKHGWFDVIDEWQIFAVFSTSRHYIQLKLSQVTFIWCSIIILPISQNYVDKKQTMTLPLTWSHSFEWEVWERYPTSLVKSTSIYNKTCFQTVYAMMKGLKGLRKKSKAAASFASLKKKRLKLANALRQFKWRKQNSQT